MNPSRTIIPAGRRKIGVPTLGPLSMFEIKSYETIRALSNEAPGQTEAGADSISSTILSKRTEPDHPSKVA